MIHVDCMSKYVIMDLYLCSPDQEKGNPCSFSLFTLTFKESEKLFSVKMIPAFFRFQIVSDAGLRMTEESSPGWFPWGLKWAVGQMTQPIVQCIFVSSVRKATTPQQVTPQACCDIWHWNSAPLSARAT